MKIRINDIDYDIIIIRKPRNKNTYIRLKDDLKIYVTTSLFTTEKTIEQLINKNISYLNNAIKKVNQKNKYNKMFHYLGKDYELVLTDEKEIYLLNDTIYIPKTIDINKFYIKNARKIFPEHLDKCYKNFTKKIPYPALTIRKMKTRWGVCNYKTNRITLNLELIKKNVRYLDYVIIHELAHFVHHNHSTKFWQLVKENYPEFKKIRKELKEYK